MIYETIPRVILRLWYESPRDQEFILPPQMYDSIESWAHEFTELAIWNVLHENNNICTHQLKNAVCIKLKNGEIRRYTICHILTSLHTVSSDRFGVVSTQEFSKMVFKDKIPCPGPFECMKLHA